MKRLLNIIITIENKVKNNIALLMLFCMLITIGATFVFIMSEGNGVEYIYNQF